MDVRYLGPLTIRRAGDEVALGGPKPRLVLAHLVVQARTVVSTETLIDAVWGEVPPTTARNTLQTYVSHLRRSIGSDRLESHGTGYLLRVDADEVDASRFESLVARGRRAETDEPLAAVRFLGEALALWRGEPFAGLAVDGPLAGEVARLQQLRWSASESRLAAQLAVEPPSSVIAELESLTVAHPLRERLWELLMLALYLDGRQADALAAFDRVRAVLAEQVGVDPSAALTQLHTRILGHDASLTRAASGSASLRSRHGAPMTDGVADTAVPFPALLSSGRRPRYVGRPALVGELQHRWNLVARGDGSHTVLLTGEPGIGKTRTATEIARSAHDDGALVLFGRCDEGLAVPYQPLLEALDWQTRHDPTLPVGRLGGELTRLIPELPDRIPELPDPVATDPSLEELRLYEAVSSWLAAVSQARPVVLVVDDLHWASTPTHRLLVHVVRNLAGEPDARILLLATYRDTEIDADHPLHATLADLRRVGAALDVLPVEPLSEPEVSALVADLTEEARTDVEGPPSRVGDGVAGGTTRVVDPLASLAFTRSRGNPFFATEILRHCIEVGAATLDGDTWIVDGPAAVLLPDSVRDVVRHRLQRLDATARELLRLVALLGPDADVAILTAVAEDADAVVDALDVTWRSGLIEETEEGRYQLTHGLIRSTLLDDLPAARRRRYHARIVDCFEAVRPDDVMALAHHSFEAGPGDEERARALRYAIAAGERALSQRASTDAIGWFTRACSLASHLPRLDPGLGLQARCGLGEAQGDTGDQTYRETLLAATQDALAAGHLDLAARAVIANHRAATVSMIGAVDRERVDALESLLARLFADRPAAGSGQNPEQRARILALLSLELTFDRTQHDRRLLLADQALAIAQAVDDPLLEAWVATTTRVPSTVPERVRELVQRTDRAASIADAGEDPFLRCAAKVTSHQARLGIGDLRGARQQAQDALELASEIGVPYLRILAGFNAVQFHAYDGDLVGAHEANAACLAFSQEVGEADTQAWWGAIEASLAVVEGTVGHLTEPIASFADAFPDLLAWRAAQAMALAVAGRHDEAREVVDDHGFRHPDALPCDWITASAWANLAVTAFELEDPELGRMLMACVGPHRDQWAHLNVFCQAPLEVSYGLAAAAVGHLNDSVEALRHGRELLNEQGLRSHLPWASAYLARALARHPDASTRDAARTVVAAGVEVARSLGMEVMEANLRAIEGSAGDR
jgi:DNA-binding SARP family transcriptional activator